MKAEMRAEAYICDNCKTLVIADEAVGISTQVDLFDTMSSYPVNYNPAKADCHHCMKCYSMHVISVAERETNRKKDENGYRLKMEEMYYLLRSQCVANYNNKVHKKDDKKVARK